MKKNILLFFAILVICSGCNKNEAFLNDLEKFVSGVEMNWKDYSEEDWLKKDKKFTELSETRFMKIRKNMTPEEIYSANELIGKYKALKIKKGFRDLKTEIKDLIQQGSGAIKELLQDSGNNK